MSDGKPMPVDGDGADKGRSDGVNDPAQRGRSEGGESGGGGYANPHGGKDGDQSGFLGHGGQTEIGYHGGGQAGEQGGDAPNAATGSDSSDGQESGAAAWRAPVYEPHSINAGGPTIEVVETSGIAEAEQLGKVGTDARYEREQESPGSG